MISLRSLARSSGTVRHGAAIAAGFALAFAMATSASAKDNPTPDYSAVIIFGDSLSDTGRLFAATGIPPAPQYFNGRASNGPVWPEYLAPAIGLDYEPLDNFAWFGATTGRANAWEEDLGVDLPGMLDELDEYVAGLGRWHRADKNALYVVFGGSNDFLSLLASGENPVRVVSRGITNIVRIVLTLRLRGAKNIAVVNLPNLGLTPRVRAIDVVVPGTADTVTFLCGSFNSLLDRVLARLRLHVIRVSAFDAINSWVANPGLYGFANVTEPGLLSGTDGFEYLFWDDIHPTTRAHELLAEVILEAVDDAAMTKQER